MSRHRPRSAVAAVALAVLLAPALAGCFQNPVDAIVERGVEEAIKGATGVEVDVTGDGSSVPSDWPTAVPLPDGSVSDGASITTGGSTTWTVTLRPQGDVPTVFAQAREALKGAGFEETFVTEAPNDASGIFGDGTYTVLLTVADSSGGTESVYVVSEGTGQ
ncbi:hypothetical protein [Ruicaihuangia caeni]|uniref:PASTA domain-containing protein n=1 Tax=Ruicaihuangia caeni TaxID=3042517 RepID=A0AAW6T766_9MICO|nr:hypothetical protein [Klugiella sp. YN-L-19]MDI2099652.1 hypothetical protein [Klugiella sp. YN-L-19]